MERQDDSSPDAEHRADVLQQQQTTNDDVGTSRSLTAALCNAPRHLRSPAACKHYCSTAADLRACRQHLPVDGEPH